MEFLIKLVQELNNRILLTFKNNVFSFSFAVLFVACLLLVLPRTYGINDNVGILFNVEQGFISVFTSYFYMKFLHHLYHISNNTPWYGLTLYFIHILSLFIFVRSLARIENFTAFFIPFLIVYLYFYSFFITQIDYTSTSIMVGANSLFALLVYLNNRKISIFFILGLGLLFSLSFLIRMPGANAVLIYGLPIIGLFLIGQLQKKIYLTYFAIFFIPFLLFLAGDNLARTYLTSPEYRQYQEFTILRGWIHDYPIMEASWNNKKLLEENNWTKNDFVRFANWHFFDERKYNIQTLDNIFKYSVLKEENKVKKYLSLYFQRLSKLVNHHENKWYVYFLLVISILITFRFYWFLTLIISSYLLYIFSTSIYLDIFYRFPTRIAHPILLMCAGFIVLLIFHLWLPKFPTKNTNRSVLILTFVFSIFLLLFNMDMRHDLTRDTSFELSLNKLQSSYQDKILYIPPFALQWEKMDPLKTYHFNFHPIFFGGTGTFSPNFYESLKKLGINKGYEMIPALMNNPNAYIVAKDMNNYFITLMLILSYIEENYDIECDVILVERLANGSTIFKLEPKN